MGGGGEWEINKILSQEPDLCPTIKTPKQKLLKESDETWTQWSPQHKEQVPKRCFSKIQRFLFQFWMNTKTYVLGERGEIHEIKGARAMDSLQGWR
jgi:hypothetical protein